MSEKLSNEERERLQKLNDTFLYEVGYQHVNNICEETDRLLEEYKDLEVPESLDQWFIQFNKEFERKKQNQRIRSRALKISKRVAAVLIIVSIAGSIVTMSVEAFRVRFFNMVIDTSERFSLVSQQEVNDELSMYEVPLDWTEYYYPSFLPEGYTLLKTESLNSTKYMYFSNSNGQEISFIQGSIDSQSQIDSEGGIVIEVDVNGNEGVIVSKDDFTILNWSNNYISFNIQGNVEESLLLEMAESVKKK